MFTNSKNSKSQGDVGLGIAIAHFVGLGYTVSVPLTDSQDYDLVVDIGGSLKRVQVKTTSYKRGKYWNFNLSVKGGNRSFNTIKKFDNSKIEILFVLTADGSKYVIPSSNITATGTMTLIDKWNEYKIGLVDS